MKRVYHLHADDVTDEVYPKTPPPGGDTFRVYEILARDPETNLQCWCSPQVQQTAETLRYEVDYEEQEDTDLAAALSEWADELTLDLERQARFDNSTHPYGSTTFDNWPRAEVEIEVDNDDLDGIDPTSWEYEQKLLDRLHEDESSQPTVVPRPNPKTAPTGASESLDGDHHE